jgi:NAD(P)-dependent dehydrogenase (short-subunit alcohol dehydrogenase family)
LAPPSSPPPLGLGTAVVQALQSAGYHVRAVVREASIEKTQAALPGTEVVSSDPSNLVNAFQGVDIVIDVMSNSVRPAGIQDFINAAEEANVQTFVACGGAFGLFVNDEKTVRLIDVVDGRENYAAMNDMHMAVQVLPTLPPSFPHCMVPEIRKWLSKAKSPQFSRSALRTCHASCKHTPVTLFQLWTRRRVSCRWAMKMLLPVL